MKKIMMGLIMWIGLTLGVSAYADEIVSLVGKKVDGSFPLIINNIRADKDVLVIDGTSYLPVRSAATLFGYEVTFNTDLMVILTKKADSIVKQPDAEAVVKQPVTEVGVKPTNTTKETPVPTDAIENKAEVIDKIKTNIIGVKSQINVVLDEIKKKEALIKSIRYDTNQSAKLQTTKEEISKLKTILVDFTKQLENLNKALKDQK
jgi:hypothetical protein